MTDAARPLLFTPFAMRGVTAPNRVAISPMVQYRAVDGMVNDFHVVHLGKFALGKAGIVFTEATAVVPEGRVTHGDLGLWHDGQIEGLRRVADYVRSEGSVPAIQLAHAGRKGAMQRAIDGNGPLGPKDFAEGRLPWDVVGPTTEPVAPGWLVPHALTPAEIAGLVEAFAVSARRADRAGFDVAEIHGAHGYLIATFLSAVSNTRTDGYGGDLAGRMRLALEIARAVRAVWPAHKPLFFRVSALDGADGWSLDDTVALAKALKTCGVDVVDCSSGGLTGSATAAPIPRSPGFQVPFAAAVKRRAGVPSMAVGLILDGPQAEAILQAGDADLIAVGRQALYDPFWTLHAAAELRADPRSRCGPRPMDGGWRSGSGPWASRRRRSDGGRGRASARARRAVRRLSA